MSRNSAISLILTWLVFVGIYLLLAGKSDPSEVVAGAVAATISLMLVRLLRDKFKHCLKMKLSWTLLLWRIPIAMLTESWQLLIALLRQLLGKETEGRLIEHEYTAEPDEHEAARQAYMTFGVCITPNSYLVYYDPTKKRALIRQLVGKELSTVDRLFVELP